MIDKRVAGAVTAGCVVVAAIIGFLANALTVANFFGFDGGSSAANQGGQLSAARTVGVVTPAERVPGTSTPAPPLPATTTAVVQVAPETKPKPPSVPQGQARPAVPEQFHGTWFGQVYQGSMDPYPVEVVITGGAGGVKIGSADYSTLGCGGRWVLQAAWDNRIRSTEQIEYQGNCVPTVVIDLLMQPDGQVFYSFNGTEGTGILYRLP